MDWGVVWNAIESFGHAGVNLMICVVEDNRTNALMNRSAPVATRLYRIITCPFHQMPELRASSPNAGQRLRSIIYHELGLNPPQSLVNDFVNDSCDDETVMEALSSPNKTASLFCEMYIDPKKYNGEKSADKSSSKPLRHKLALSDYHVAYHDNPSPTDGREHISALTGHLEIQGQEFWTQGIGDGPMECLIELLRSVGLVIHIIEHELGDLEHPCPIQLEKNDPLSGGKIVAYVKCSDIRSCTAWGIGCDQNEVDASLKALVHAATSLMA